MMKRLILLSGLALAIVTGQNSPSCCDRRAPECQSRYSQCLMQTQGICETLFCTGPLYPLPTTCCDSKDPQCQMKFNECMTGTYGSFSLCQPTFCTTTDQVQTPTQTPFPSLAPPSIVPFPTRIPDISSAPSIDPLPSKFPDQTNHTESGECCNPTTQECMARITMCMLENMQTPQVCEPIACKISMTPIPSRPECCDGSTAQCQAMIQQCIQESGRPDMCQSYICPVTTSQSSPHSTHRPTQSPFPTKFIKPLFSPFASRIPLKTKLPSTQRIPELISSVVKFPKGNPVELRRPEKIQKLIASISCSLRIPVESIEIRNITIQKPDGKLIPVEFDQTFARLSANSSSSCLLTDITTTQRRDRQLQTSSDTVAVSYDISNPPQEIAFADASTLTDAMNNAQMNSLASSIGSTGAVVSTDSPQQTPSTTTQQSTSSSSVTSSPGFIVGFVALAVVASFGIVGYSYELSRRRRLKQITQVRPQPVPVVIVNPVTTVPSAPQLSARTIFGTSQARV